MTDEEVTTNEIMDFLQEHMVTRGEFLELKEEVTQLDSKVTQLDSKVTQLDVKLNQTKLDLIDAMDDKLADLKGDLIVLMRKGDKKLSALIEILIKKKLLSQDEASAILALEPFPR